MFFLNFRWFYFKKGNHVCLKENAVPIWHFFSTVPKCLGAKLSFSTGAEMSCFRCKYTYNTIMTMTGPSKIQTSKSGNIYNGDTCLNNNCNVFSV